jgi:predicted nucleic acid-binding protein
LALQPAKEARLDLPEPGLRRRQDPDWLCHDDDVFIGAHAAVTGFRLLSRDAQRSRAYFPTIHLVTPYAPSVAI